MAPVTRQAIRGTVFQQDFAEGRAGVQNGTYNRQVHMSNTWGDTSGILRIDCDGVSRPRFPASIVAQLRGTFTLLTNANGAPEVVSTAPFSYRVTTTATFGMTLLANIPPVGFTVAATVVPNPGYANETVLTVTSSTVGPEFRSTLDFEITSMSSTDESTTNFQMPFPDRLPLQIQPSNHPDVVTYLVNIAANGGTMRAVDVAGFNAWAESVAPIRSKILHYSPVAGNDLNAARVKFYRNSHEVSNLLTFNNVVDADYSPASGFQAGTGRHIDSGFTPSLSPMQDFTANGALSAGFGCLLVSNGTGGGSQVDMGADHTGGLLGQRRVLMQNSGGSRLIDLYTSVERLTSAGSVLGFVFGSLNGNTMTHFDDGVSIGSRARSNITGQDMRPDVPVFFGCNNAQGVAAFHSTRQLRHFTLTLGLTNDEAQLLSTAMNTLQAVLAS